MTATDEIDHGLIDDNFEGMVNEANQILSDPAAERALLGFLLLQPEAVDQIKDVIGEADLIDPFHRRIYTKVCRAYDDGWTISVASIVDALGGDAQAKIAEDVTVGQYLARLMAEADPQDDPVDIAEYLVGVSERRATSVEPLRDPEPFTSKFGMIMWADQNMAGPEYEYLVEDLIPKGESVLIMGESQTGKSFLTLDLALSGAQAKPFFGRRILQPFGTVWCAYEAARGQAARMRAYRKYHGLDLEDLPFAVLTKPLALWPDPKAAGELIEEIQHIERTCFRGIPLGMVVFDTYNAATPGASEIDSQVVSQIRLQFDRIRAETHAASVIVGHTNALGKHRGNEQLTNNIDTVIRVSRKTKMVNREPMELRDDDGRPVRVMKVQKQREGQDGETHEFVLHVVDDGTKNQYGRPRTSCVIASPRIDNPPDQIDDSGRARTSSLGVSIPTGAQIFLDCVIEAMNSDGIPTPATLGLPRSIPKVADFVRVKRMMFKKTMRDDGVAEDAVAIERHRDATSKALKRARERLLSIDVIGNDSTTNTIWWTGKPVRGMPATQPRGRTLFDRPDRNQPDEFFANEDFGDFR